MQDLARVDEVATPAELIHGVVRQAGKALGVSDPYADEKKRWIDEATSNADWVREAVDGAADPFAAALQLAVAANVLDSELRHELGSAVSLKSLVEDYAEVPLALDNLEDLRLAVQKANSIVFVHDSAGEMFFDRLAHREVRQTQRRRRFGGTGDADSGRWHARRRRGRRTGTRWRK